MKRKDGRISQKISKLEALALRRASERERERERERMRMMIRSKTTASCQHSAMLPRVRRVASVSSPWRVTSSSRLGASPQSSKQLERHKSQAGSRRMAAMKAPGATRRAGEENEKTLVKICGVMTPEDAKMVGEKGADFIGFILSDGYKRSVDAETAKELVRTIVDMECQPVGIFTRETAEEMTDVCNEIGLKTVQLHGDTPRLNLKDLPASLSVFYVVHSEGGKITTPLPAELAQIDLSVPDPAYWKKPIDWVSAGRRNVDYILVDKKEAGGTGQLDWDSLIVPKGCSRKGWIMAGGLTPDNVGEAVQRFQPSVVDVSGGVTDSSGLKKDEDKVGDFIANAKSAA